MSRVFIEVDLRQAESRFVAYDSADANLIEMLENPLKDIHRYVAAEIFEKPESEITHAERQLGKKSGHGANYNMGVGTFQESCLKEMDLVLSKEMATRTLEAYHRLFPGIRRWHKATRDTLYRERKLINPFGRVRYFYGRLDDSTYREAYAWKPQSTIPDLTSHLMLGLCAARDTRELDFALHNQCHDSLLMSCRTESVRSIAEFCLNLDRWHPKILLPGGSLRIPTEVQVGRCLGALEKYK